MTGYVRTVRDDLTAFVYSKDEAVANAAANASAAAAVAGARRPSNTVSATNKGVAESDKDFSEGKEETEGEGGAIGQTLAILARLGEDLDRMVRLKGRVEHQVFCCFLFVWFVTSQMS